MTDYKGVVRHVRYWRGEPQKWSTVYPFTGSGTTPDVPACTILGKADSAMLYGQGSGGGGIWQVEFYRASGGTPIASLTNFDPESPTAWAGMAGATPGWSSVTGYTFEPAAEVALGVRWQAGLSSSGKPVYLRKWYHMVPKSQQAAGTAGADVASANVTSLQAAALALQTALAPTYGLALGNARRLASTNPIVNPFYENHQMPRGRRRKVVIDLGGGATTNLSPGKYPKETIPEIPE